MTEKANNIKLENVQNVLEELKQKENMLKNKIIKQTKRLTSAFPTMKSETINQFLNQKIDFFKNDKK